MPKAPEGYRPLLNRGTRGSLWLADDHLLVIESTRFLLCIRETYRRLDFHNIQAILHAKSQRGAWITGLCIAAFCIALVIIASSGFSPSPSWFFAGLFAVPALAALIGNLIMGETRSLIIQTTVHPWRLRMVTRRNHVLKILATLDPLCQAAQQQIALAIGAARTASTPSGTSTTPLPPPLAPPPPVQGVHPLALPAWLCFLAYACMMGGELIWNSFAATITMMALGAIAFILLMIAFTRGGGTLATGGRFVFSFAVTMIGVSIAAGYAAAMGVMMQSAFANDSSALGSETAMIRSIAEFPEGMPNSLVTVATFIVAITAASAICGIIASIRRMSLHRRSSPLPPAPSPS